MANSENKTKPTGVSVAHFIASVPDPLRRAEAEVLDAIHRRVTGQEPRMWGPTMIGYGQYHYKYASGREGDAMRGGFSPRKAAMTVYLMGNIESGNDEAGALFAQLGKHKTGVCCLYINRLEQIDQSVLEQLIALSWEAMNAKYPG